MLILLYRLYESAIECLHVLSSWLQRLSSLFYIFIWDGQKWELHLVVWFSQLKGILKHMNFFLGGYLHTLIRFFPISIKLYSQKINHLNVQKYLSLNLSFLMIWYIQGLPLRKLIQKKFVVCFFFFLKLIWTMCRNCFRKLVTWNVIQFIMTGVGDQRYLVNSGMIRSFWWILSALLLSI